MSLEVHIHKIVSKRKDGLSRYMKIRISSTRSVLKCREQVSQSAIGQETATSADHVPNIQATTDVYRVKRKPQPQTKKIHEERNERRKKTEGCTATGSPASLTKASCRIVSSTKKEQKPKKVNMETQV